MRTNCELEVYIGTEKQRVFLQQGFYRSSGRMSPLHSHNYTEFHLISGGSACFRVDDRLIEMKGDSMMVIPRGLFHSCVAKEDGTRHTAFQMDREMGASTVYSLPKGVVSDFFEEIQRLAISKDYTKIAAYISLIGSFLEGSSSLVSRKITDYGFLIHEFFSLHYREGVHLCDLAKELRLSERQTERLVLSHTGRTFRQALAHTRLTIAFQLMKCSDMPLTEIARYVGYESYAGFWKAMKKYQDENK